MINVYEANDILKHLINTNQEFCFLPDGRFITREDCKNKLESCNFIEGFSGMGDYKPELDIHWKEPR